MKPESTNEEVGVPSLVSTPAESPEPAAEEHKPGRKGHRGAGGESDPPSSESSEDDEEEEEEEERPTSERGEDTEPEYRGRRPLLMDSEEHSSDSDCDSGRVKNRRTKAAAGSPSPQEDSAMALIAPPETPGGARAAPALDPVDVFGAVPFLGGTSPVGPSASSDIFVEAPFRQVDREQRAADDIDVFTKAPFNRNLSKPSKSGGGDVPMGQTPPVSPEGIDVFGFSPFQPGPAEPPAATGSAERVSRPSPEESTSPQQRLKQRSLQRLSARHKKTKQEAAGKRHHGTPTGGRKTGRQPTYRTPERARRLKKVGRRDSQSSNEFPGASDSKEDVTMSEGKDEGAPLAAADVDAPLDPFGAEPFQPPDGGGRYRGLAESQSDRGTANGGARSFIEMVPAAAAARSMSLLDLDPFGAAPFPTKE